MKSTSFFRLVNSPIKFRLFLFSKLPAAFFSGLKIVHCNEEECTVSIPYKWFTQNPFRSTYFACLGMAAEMSTGALAMAHVYQRKPVVSMLITAVESKFLKKAVDKTFFVCNEGGAIKHAVEQACATGNGQTITVVSKGFNQQNELVAEFLFTWSFKVKQ